jgi:hypothetical protein
VLDKGDPAEIAQAYRRLIDGTLDRLGFAAPGPATASLPWRSLAPEAYAAFDRPGQHWPSPTYRGAVTTSSGRRGIGSVAENSAGSVA